MPSSDNPNAFQTGCRQGSGSLRRMPGHLRTTLALSSRHRRPRARRAGPGRAVGDGEAPRRADQRCPGLARAAPAPLLLTASGGCRRLVAPPRAPRLLPPRRPPTGMGEVIAWGTCEWFRPGRAVRMWLRSPVIASWSCGGASAPSAPAGRGAVAKLRLRRDGRRALPLGTTPS